jgi:hypothetical protein
MQKFYIFTIIIILAAAGYYYFAPAANGPEEAAIAENIMEDNAVVEDGADISDWKTYQNNTRMFEIKYPSDLNAREVYTHNVVVCFDSDSKPLELCIGDAGLPNQEYSQEAFEKLLLGRLEEKFGFEVNVSIGSGKYSVYINNIVIYSENENLLRNMLATLNILGVNKGSSK